MAEKKYLFPVVVQGDWGCSVSKSVKNKLLLYFQSPKRSGGGECKIHVEPGRDEQVEVCFEEEEVRQRVLHMKIHEVDMPEKKKLKLTVSLPPATAETMDENVSLGGPEQNRKPSTAKESQESVSEQVISPKCPNPDLPVKREPKLPESMSIEDLKCSAAGSSQDKHCPANVTGEKRTQEEFCVLIETSTGEEIDRDFVEMYFENKKRSGGGPIKSYVKDDQQIIITFEAEEDAQEVLRRKNHSIKNITLHVRQYQQQVAQDRPQMSSSLVVLENVQETVTQCMLGMLLENASGLSEQDDFTVEMIHEVDAAVITLIKPTDTDQVVKTLNRYHIVKQLNISARSLEVTKSILVENIPPDISRDYIIVYFESKKHGGGPVSDVNYLPEENSAIVTFQDGKVLATVLARKHYLNNMQILVHLYYISLGTALYGKERPQIPMPDPISVSLDPYHWQFLQQNQWMLQEISHEMANHFCEIEWPTGHCAHPETTMRPLRALSKQKKSLARTWNEDVSTWFAQLLSKQKVVKCALNAEVWEAIRNSLVKDDILILPDIPKGMVVLVGAAQATDHAEEEMKMLIENAAKKLERERQTIEETLAVASGKYTILNNAGLQERVCLDYPDLKLAYDASKEHVTLRGVAAEVFKIKSDILERVSGMVWRSVDLHPHILLFLNHVDNGTLSQLLFWAKNINAFYELDQEAVLLTAVTVNDLLEAEKELMKDLAYKCVELEDKSVIRKREWKELTLTLYKAHNCSSETLIIDEQEDQIVVAGYFKEVADAHQKLSSFVDRHTHIQKTIRTKSVAVAMYAEKEKRSAWLNVAQRGVKVHFGTQTNRKLISLEGPRVEVMKGLDILQNILSSLYATSMVVDKPGAKAFFKEQEDLYITGAQQQFNCLIRIEEHTDEDDGDRDGNVDKEKGGLCSEVKLRDGVLVKVHKGDLTRYPVDVVVNASNEELQHIGGLADALSKAAGPELQRECNALVKKHGSIQPGKAVITDAWNLPCKQVIHAVGPRWNSFEKEKCTLLLKKAVKESLHLAETYNHRSIAIPAVSSGIFGFPLKECAHSIVTAVKEALEESAVSGCLKQICLVDSSKDTVWALSHALNEVFRHESFSSKQSSSSKVDNRSREKRTEYQGITTSEGLNIILQKQGIEDSTTDVIVNSISRDLQLDRGPLSKALLRKAGKELQVELIEQGHGETLKEGCVLKTNGYALGCSQVLHATLPAWDQSQTSQEKVLKDIIEECLNITEQQSLKSITIPALGTGNLRFPKPLVARLMFDEVFKFSQRNPRFLQEVHFVLHPSDTDTIKAFTAELNRRPNFSQASSSATPTPLESSQQGQAGRISTLASGIHKMQIGSITLQVECGDITQETTDAIVNISNDTFTLKNGVSKAILEAAGPQMEVECAQLASQPHNNLICTQGGNLKCKNVIHLAAQNDVKAQVSKALAECEQRKFTSIAFPAIGTGQAQRDPFAVADDMIDAIVDFTSQTPAPVVKNIKIIIFQPHLQAVFYASMQKKEAAASKPSTLPSKSVVSRLADAFFSTFKKPTEAKKPVLRLERTIEPAIFQICGDSQKNVEATESWIRTLISKDQYDNKIVNEWISSFGETEYEKLKELQANLYVVIKLETGGSVPSLHVRGITKHVLTACTEIQKMIHSVRESQEEQTKANLLSNIVEWRYEHNGQYKAFDSLTNMHIETATQQQRLYETTIRNKRYTVDPRKMCATDDQGKSIVIQRVSKAEDNLALPEDWEDMQQMHVKVVEMKLGSKDYQDVQTMFRQTCPSFTIEKIERIQNPYHWQAYQIKKQEMDDKNGTRNNERLLFHGTAGTTLTQINRSGFNRSYAGMHGAAYGNGTYFAVHANYSAQDGYAKPDANGKKYMYLARVLVGEYCVGSTGLVVPKAKTTTTDPTNLFDSVTDNVTKPSMFVIFNDIQAYPEYLITFRK